MPPAAAHYVQLTVTVLLPVYSGQIKDRQEVHVKLHFLSFARMQSPHRFRFLVGTLAPSDLSARGNSPTQLLKRPELKSFQERETSHFGLWESFFEQYIRVQCADIDPMCQYNK